MRRFFSFRSSTSSSGNSSSAHSVHNNENALSESLQKKDVKISKGGKVRERFRSPLKQNQGSEGSSAPQLRRSVSYSYPAIYCGMEAENTNYVHNLSPPCCGNSPRHDTECHVHSNSLTPERHARTKKGDLAQVRKLHASERTDSPDSSRDHPCSSGNSPYGSPVSLRCRTARLTQISNRNEVLDLYIDGENQDSRFKKEQHSSDTGNDGCIRENRALNKSRRPPRAQSTAPSSPTFSKENHRTYSFREVKDVQRHFLTKDCSNDDFRSISPQKFSKLNANNQPHAYPGKFASGLRDCDSETTTVEDIYEDSADIQPTSHSNGVGQKHHFDPVSATDNISCDGAEESFGFQRKSYFLGHGSKFTKDDKFMNSDLEEHDIEELMRKGKEVEQKLMLLSEEDHELDELMQSSIDMSTLLQTIRNIVEDRRCLAYELSSQIKCRLVDRSSVKEGFRRAKVELDTRTRRLEKEKNELQSTLEKELDRRSSDWSLKLEKFQSEEQRLRERVRELAEQNVSLQREISSLKGNELDHRSRIMNSEMQLNDLTTAVVEVRTENQSLHHALSELQARFNGSEEDLDCMRRNYKVTEKENKDLQKLVVRLQRICSEQDKTINGLRQGFSDEIGKQSVDEVDNVSRLQMEQLRLAGVEQMLRRELESCRHEIESLRHENICLLDRLKGTRDGCGISFKLEAVLCAQVDCLQAQGLSLLNDNNNLCRDLVVFLRRKQCDHGSQEIRPDFDEYSVAEYATKYQRLRRAIENFGRTLHTVSSTLEEKSSLETLDCQSQTTEGGQSRQSKCQFSEDQLELKLKAESLLTGLLREKLFSKEQELEQLQADLASSVKSNDVLQSEIQRLQDEVSRLTHKTRDTEIQMLKKDENTNQLRQDLQECTKDLIAARGILMKVTGERDHMWEEVKHSKETIMLLNHEVKSLKKKIEALDEDSLIKEGQISILKDNLGDKPFDTIYSPKSVKKISLE